MTSAALVRLYLQALRVELKQCQEYADTGRWHVDCACAECRILEHWHALPWWQRLRAKLAH